MILIVFVLISCIKFLLISSYHSTDFEVHRNWLAITYNLPINKWYFEDSSKWTLDYPPLFAWFEYGLSHFAKFFDPQMLKLDNHNYASFYTVLFQRLSVIATDSILAYGAYECSKVLNNGWRTGVVLPLLLITNVGLLMVDHIHFQYNGFMFGILLLSIANMFKNRYLQAYFVYLLKNYCFTSHPFVWNFKQFHNIAFKNIVYLGSSVIAVFVLTYLPFIYQLQQVFQRMFPFKRGLCHAYWAPNVWALYNVVDKGSFLVAKKIGLNVTVEAATMTGGLVQEFSHSMLPDVTPLTTVVLSAIFMLPAMYKLWISNSNAINFLRCLVICALTSFLFGWHVHEKAILMSIIPLSILSVLEAGDAKVFLLLSTVGHYSLFPLLFPSSLLFIKLILLLLYSLYSFYSLSNLYPLHVYKYSLPLLNSFESIYLLGLLGLFVYDNIFHNLLGLSNSLPFLPLMLTSIYCSLGVIYSWLKLYIYFLNKTNVIVKSVKKRK